MLITFLLTFRYRLNSECVGTNKTPISLTSGDNLSDSLSASLGRLWSSSYVEVLEPVFCFNVCKSASVERVTNLSLGRVALGVHISSLHSSRPASVTQRRHTLTQTAGPGHRGHWRSDVKTGTRRAEEESVTQTTRVT